MTTTAPTSTTPTSTTSITQALGVGSGVDTAALVTSLVNAQFDTKNKQLAAKADTLTAQISTVAKLRSNITAFSSAVDTLVKNGSLVTQPTSTNTNVITATALSGAKLSGLSASIEVTSLAAGQTATTTTPIASRATTIGTGTLTLRFGTATIDNGAFTAFTAGATPPIAIAIDSAHATLDGIAQAINAAKTGVTATIVTDVDGTARITLKGPTGSASAFTLSGDTPELSALDIGVGKAGTTIGTKAVNARLSLDGVAVERASNSVSDLIDGVKLDLLSASVGNPIKIGSATPIAGLTQAVNDFVDTFNQVQGAVKAAIDLTTGDLHNDTAANTLSRSLGQLTLTKLVTDAPAGAPTTLAEIGVATNRDGTLSVRADQLSAALAKYPDAVEALFAATANGGGINAALKDITDVATGDKVAVRKQGEVYGLAASTARYTKAEAAVESDETKALADADKLRAQLTKQFAASDARVAAYKSSMAFLQNQIDAWNAPKQ